MKEVWMDNCKKEKRRGIAGACRSERLKKNQLPGFEATVAGLDAFSPTDDAFGPKLLVEAGKKIGFGQLTR